MSMLTREQDLDCFSHLCRFARVKTGMRTNGRCTCVDKLISQIFEQRQRIAELEAEVLEEATMTKCSNFQHWDEPEVGCPLCKVCYLNCSGGCPFCSPEDHQPECAKQYTNNKEGRCRCDEILKKSTA